MFFQILHEKVHDEIVDKLTKAYSQLRIGDPLDGKCFVIQSQSGNPRGFVIN